MKNNNTMEELAMKTLHLSFVAFSTVFCIANASAKETKPNILWIMFVYNQLINTGGLCAYTN